MNALVQPGATWEYNPLHNTTLQHTTTIGLWEGSRFIESDTSRVCVACWISAPAAGRWWSSAGAPEGPWRRRARRAPASASLPCPAGRCTWTGRWGWRRAGAGTGSSQQAVPQEWRGPWTHPPARCRLWPKFGRRRRPHRASPPPPSGSRLPAPPGPLYSRRSQPELSRDVLVWVTALWQLWSRWAARRLHRKSFCHPDWRRAGRCHLEERQQEHLMSKFKDIILIIS